MQLVMPKTVVYSSLLSRDYTGDVDRDYGRRATMAHFTFSISLFQVADISKPCPKIKVPLPCNRKVASPMNIRPPKLGNFQNSCIFPAGRMGPQKSITYPARKKGSWPQKTLGLGCLLLEGEPTPSEHLSTMLCWMPSLCTGGTSCTRPEMEYDE